jgi:hypothetical protein
VGITILFHFTNVVAETNNCIFDNNLTTNVLIVELIPSWITPNGPEIKGVCVAE